jgi:putative protease
VVDTWRKQINNFIESGKLLADDSNLHKVFNRSFTNSFLQGDLNKKMFTDNPRDNSVNYAVEKSDAISVVQIHDVKQDLYNDKNALGAELADKIKDLSIDKVALTFAFTAKENTPLTLNIMAGNTSFEVKTDSLLRVADEIAITPETIDKRFRSFSNATFDLAPMNFDKHYVITRKPTFDSLVPCCIDW